MGLIGVIDFFLVNNAAQPEFGMFEGFFLIKPVLSRYLADIQLYKKIRLLSCWFNYFFIIAPIGNQHQ
jgi:hypothetical protein